MLSNYSFIYSLFIYGMTMVSMVMFAIPFFSLFPKKLISVQQKRQRMFCMIFMSLIFGLVFGMRWDVGIDHLAYLNVYLNHDTDRFEFLFKLINENLPKFGVHYVWYFSILAFVQIFTLFYALKNEAYLWPFLIISLFGGVFFWDWMNVIRQELASCIMFLSINYIIRRNLIKFLLCLLIALGFHNSAIIWIIILPFIYKGKSLIPPCNIQLALLLIMTILVCVHYDVLSNVFPILNTMQELGMMGEYGIYSESVLQKFGEMTNIGFLFISFFIINLILIYYYPDLKFRFDGKRFRIYYNLYFWGYIFEMFVASNLVLCRPFRYFRIYKLVIIAYLLYYLYKYRKDILAKIIFIVIIGLFALNLLSISKNSPFNFFFEIPNAP